MRYFIELSYNGEKYHGWQNQPNAISVQEVLEKAITTLLRSKISILGAGRTDAGVHAKQMFAHFDTDIVFDRSELTLKLNSFLPKDVAVYDIHPVKKHAHARFDATGRTYEYWIVTEKNPFHNQSAHLVYKKLDVDLMNAAAKELFNYEDFKSFSKTHTDVKTYICKIEKAVWEQRNELLVFTIRADRFLRNMVRAIVGTLLEVGLGKLSIEEFKQIIESRDRNNAGTSVPGKALYLTAVTYPEETFITHG
ncbi:tRNA pseudouridine(38-40) synthase TruA [Kordia sp. YSTF-M3]|uniref:tRNA pseudouridine synthase A n=1 Tax=Kordia aestuariivivens TaxID=2759037 RepID=A0ABR7QDQ5_9FLAO|nr:tRNA pseudouridine(38-40) synthase TruA [Kordia aestuariivivens]MBC8756516.1 tRNA pseudouridine(38-40) synthase TruA [Kordia aestuariivivens]